MEAEEKERQETRAKASTHGTYISQQFNREHPLYITYSCPSAALGQVLKVVGIENHDIAFTRLSKGDVA